MVATWRSPVSKDRSALWDRQALKGFQTSEARPEQLLLKDKARTSRPSFPHRIFLILALLFCRHIGLIFSFGSGEHDWGSRQYTFHKGHFCPDVFLIVVLRQDDDLWNESGAWGPSVPIQSTSRCLIGLNGIRRRGVASTEMYSHTNRHARTCT